MVNIGIDTAVYCADKFCGYHHSFILNPVTWRVTYLVVKPQNLPPTAGRVERLVPFSWLAEVSPATIHLNHPLADFAQLSPFTETQYMAADTSDGGMYEPLLWFPIPPAIQVSIPIKRQNLPPGEIIVNRHTQIEARNGHIGQFEQFRIMVETGQITHFIFQRGHLWERKNAILPITAVDCIEGETIYLKLNKAEIK